jgi:hypothetical protein
VANKSLILNLCVFLTVANLPANSVEQPQVPHLTFQVPWLATEVHGPTWCKSPDARGTEKPFGFKKLRLRPFTLGINQQALIGCVTNNTGQPLSAESVRVRYTVAKRETGGVDREMPYPQYAPLAAVPVPFSSGQPTFFFIPFDVTASAVDMVIEIPNGRGQPETYPVQRLSIIRR